MDAIFAQYSGDDVAVFAVGTGGEERLESIRTERAPRVPMPRATDAWREASGMIAFPETLFIDRQGRIAERLLGGQDAAYFAARIDALLAEPPPQPLAVPTSDGEPASAAIEGEAPPASPAQEEVKHGIVARVVYGFLRVFGRH